MALRWCMFGTTRTVPTDGPDSSTGARSATRRAVMRGGRRAQRATESLTDRNDAQDGAALCMHCARHHAHDAHAAAAVDEPNASAYLL
jgi:hypothetical protein